MRLNTIKDNPGARRAPKLLGRGIGSGLGKTSGRGGKGQTARSGSNLNGFEGGQNPIYRRLPKRGFVNIHRKPLFELTLRKLERLLATHAIEEPITAALLKKKSLMKPRQVGIALIATGSITKAVTIEVVHSSKKAQASIEALGGKVIYVSKIEPAVEK